jgi:hypothetical protein
MAFREVSRLQGSGVKKWDTVGDSIEGIYRGMKNGKTFSGNSQPSKLGQIEVGGTVVIIGAPTVLASSLSENVGLGDVVRITYLGKERGKNGAEYKNFRVEIDSGSEEIHDGVNVVSENKFSTPSTPVTGDYQTLVALLTAKVGADTARLMGDMLNSGYPDLDKRTNALKSLLKQQGVQV